MGTLLRKFSSDAQSATLLEESGRRNPMCTPEFARAMQGTQHDVWIVGPDDDRLADVALGCVKRGRLGAALEFLSLPAAAAHNDFWTVVERLVKVCRVTDLTAGTFASPEFRLPPLPGETSRRKRTEYVLDLVGTDMSAVLSTNHKRNVKKALKAGVTVKRGRDDPDRVAAHLRLMDQSRVRRTQRGEAVVVDLNDSSFRAFLSTGAGELFQAVQDGRVLSSVLVLRSPEVAYYQTAGSSSEGMSTGASHWLITEIARILQVEGVQEFNLGGAPEGSTLARFKQGFGARVVRLEAAESYVGPLWKRRLRTIVALVRSNPQKLATMVTGSSSRLLVYGTDTSTNVAAPAVAFPDRRFAPLTEAEVRALTDPPGEEGFSGRHVVRLDRLGKSYAWAVYVGGSLAHISWLLPADAVARDIPAVLELEADEAEITGCETLGAFQGKGIYGFAIQQLVVAARAQGVRRIYMKTSEANVASQRGILKAGLNEIGRIRMSHPPLQPSRTIIRREINW